MMNGRLEIGILNNFTNSSELMILIIFRPLESIALMSKYSLQTIYLTRNIQKNFTWVELVVNQLNKETEIITIKNMYDGVKTGYWQLKILISKFNEKSDRRLIAVEFLQNN